MRYFDENPHKTSQTYIETKPTLEQAVYDYKTTRNSCAFEYIFKQIMPKITVTVNKVLYLSTYDKEVLTDNIISGLLVCLEKYSYSYVKFLTYFNVYMKNEVKKYLIYLRRKKRNAIKINIDDCYDIAVIENNDYYIFEDLKGELNQIEFNICKRLYEGKRCYEISKELQISSTTVTKYLKSLRQKVLKYMVKS